MDNYNPNLVWYATGVIMMMSAGIFLLLQLKAPERFDQTEEELSEDLSLARETAG
jgi:hypothetical protein